MLWFPRERFALVNGCFVMVGACGAIAATTPDHWAGVGGHYPPIAYRTALIPVIVPQIAALAWFVLPGKAGLRRVATASPAVSP